MQSVKRKFIQKVYNYVKLYVFLNKNVWKSISQNVIDVYL